MADDRQTLQIDIQFESEASVNKKLNNLLKNIQNNTKFKIEFDTNAVSSSLKTLSDELNKINSQLTTAFNGSNILKQSSNINSVTNAYKQQGEAIKQLGTESSKSSKFTLNPDGSINELVSEVTKLNTGLGQTVTIANNAKTGLSTMTQSANFDRFSNTIDTMKTKLNGIKANNFIDDSVIQNLQSKLNSINTDTPEKEIRELQSAITNLGSSDSQIVRVQNAITKMESNLTAMKGKYGNLVGDSSSQAQLKAYEGEVNNLKQTLSDLSGGKTFSGAKISSELNKASSASRELKNSIVQSSSALNLATKDASSLGDTFKRALQNVGIYASTAMLVREMVQGLREASEYIIEIDKRMTNMQMITGQTREQVGVAVDQFKQLGAELHTTNREMLAGAEEVMRAGYDAQTSQQLMSASILGSKISGQSTEQTTEQLIAMKNAFDMTGGSMEHVIDMISLMDNRSATSFSEISQAIQRTAFSAQEAGTPFENLIAYVTTVSEKTRKSAEVIGESFKTIYARYSTIKLGNLDEDGKSINDTERAMQRIGIQIRENEGQFRKFDDVLQEFITKYKSGQITQVDYLAGVQALSGTRQRETLMSLIENVDTLKVHQEDLANSTGMARKMFDEAYSDSLDAKINDLKRSFEGMYESVLNSDALKTGIDILTELIDTFGNLGSIIAITTTLFLAFKGKAILDLTKSIIGGITNMVSYQMAIGATGIASAVTAGLVDRLSVAIASNPIGIWVTAITLCVGSLYALATYTSKADERLENMNKTLAENVKNTQSTIAEAEKYIAKIDELNNKLSETNDIEERKKITEELVEAQKGLAETMPESATSTNSNGDLISTQIETAKQLIELKKQEQEIDAHKFFEENQGLKNDIENLQAKRSELEKMKVAQAQGKDSYEKQFLVDRSATGQNIYKTSETKFNADDMKKLNDEITTTVTNMGRASQMAGVLGDNLTASESDINNSIRNYNVGLELNSQKLGENEKAQGLLADATDKTKENIEETNKALKEISGTFDGLGDSIGIIDTVLKEMKDYGGVTESTYSKLMSKYPDVLREMTKEGDMIQNLTNLKKEYQKEQKGQLDQAWKTASGEISISNKQLSADIEAYNETAETKIKMDNNKKVSTADMVNYIMTSNSAMTNALKGDYGTDTQNWANYLKTKLENFSDFAKQIIIGSISIGEAIGGSIGKGLSGFDGLDMKISMPKLLSSAPNLVGDSSTKNSKKEAEDIKRTADRYLELKNNLDLVNDSLETNKTLQEQAHGQAKIDLINKEIDLLEKQAQAEKNLENAYRNRASSLRSTLSGKGTSFDSSGNISNYNALLESYRNRYNSNKTDANKKAYEDLKELLDEYNTLVRDSITSSMNDYQKTLNEMTNIQNEKAKLIANSESKISDIYKNEVQKRIDEENKAWQKKKELLSKEWTEEDNADTRADLQKELSDIDAQIQQAIVSGDKQLANTLRKQYAEKQAELNKVIQDQQREAMTNEIDDKIQANEDKLEELMKPENINKIIKNALETGVLDVMGETVKLADATKDYINDTTIGVTNINLAYKEQIDLLNEAQKAMLGYAQISSNLGLSNVAILNNINRSAIPQSSNINNGRTVSVAFNSPIVQVDNMNGVDDSKLEEYGEQVANTIFKKIESVLP